MPRPSTSLWRGACLAVLLAVLPAGVGAQQRTGQAGGQQQQDTTLTPEERIRLRLQNISPLITDTARDTLAADSAAADSARARGRPMQGALPGVQRDSIMQRLLALSGYFATEYKSDTARFEADSGRLDLLRNAAVLEDGQTLTADSSLTYWEERSLACARGNPQVSGAGTAEPLVGDSLCYNTTTRLGFVRNARTTVSEGAEWHINGDFYVVDDRYYGHDAIFTDCDLEEPHYHFAAKDMKVMRGDVIVARNVTMKFGDVPVFWVPFFVQSLGRGRQSGLLFPGFQVNDIVRTSSGYDRRITDVGFYWAINDYFGARLALDWYSNNWTAVNGSFDYRFLDRFLEGGATLRRYWRQDGSREFTIATRNQWEVNERTRVSLTANYATSSAFVRDNSFDPREINQNISSDAGINRRFDWGTLNVTANRSQYLSDDRVTTTLPRVGLNISTITLFEALPGDESWYSNATWTANGDASVVSRDPGQTASITNRSQRDVTAHGGSSFSLGNLSWSQGVDLTRVDRDPYAIDSDTLFLDNIGNRFEQRLKWNTSLGYQQRLIGTSTITPSLSIRGEMLTGDTTGGQRIAAPTRLDFGANLRTDIYGFWPGFGPIERFRHRVTPGIAYSYSPAPTVTDAQRQYFGVTEVREQNRITLTLNQTFEAKMRQPEDTTAAAADSAAAAEAAPSTGEPRRIPRNQPIQLLSLTTSAMAYDFVQAREDGDGFVTTSITNSITSDLLRGLQLSITHDLFERPAPGETGTDLSNRKFSPALTQLSASFSLNSDSWIARMLGLGRGSDERPQQDTTGLDTTRVLEAGASIQNQGDQLGLIGAGRRTRSAQRGAVGTWNANFNYSLARPREGVGQENQQLTATVSFQPTENWAVNWNTGYSFTSGKFTDHVLTFTRSLHDWDANFDFVRTQTGNFSFQFRVALRANRDIKLDYEQRERQDFFRTPGQQFQ